MRSEAENARRMNGWMVIRAIRKVRFRVRGSCCRWFWLASIIRGSSQHERTSRGEEIWSMLVHCVRFLWG